METNNIYKVKELLKILANNSRATSKSDKQYSRNYTNYTAHQDWLKADEERREVLRKELIPCDLKISDISMLHIVYNKLRNNKHHLGSHERDAEYIEKNQFSYNRVSGYVNLLMKGEAA